MEVDNKDNGKEQTIITMTHNFQGGEQPEINISTQQVDMSEEAKQDNGANK